MEPHELTNGSMEIELAAGDVEDQRLIVRNTADNIVIRLPNAANYNATELLLYMTCATLIIRLKWYLWCGEIDANVDIDNTVTVHEVPDTSNSISQSLSVGIGTRMRSIALGMCLNTKVNMWLFNRHVEEGLVDIAKEEYGDLVDVARLNHMLDTVGHWISTKAAWYLFGIDDLWMPPRWGTMPPIQITTWPEITEDIKMRIRTGPAGTAKTTICKAVFDKCRHSIYNVLMTPSLDYESLSRVPDSVTSALYHVDARNFTNGEQRSLWKDVVNSGVISSLPYSEIDDELVMEMSAFCHAAMPDDPLLSRQILFSLRQVVNHNTYVKIWQARNSMMMINQPITAMEAVLLLKANWIDVGNPLGALNGVPMSDNDDIEVDVV